MGVWEGGRGGGQCNVFSRAVMEGMSLCYSASRGGEGGGWGGIGYK